MTSAQGSLSHVAEGMAGGLRPQRPCTQPQALQTGRGTTEASLPQGPGGEPQALQTHLAPFAAATSSAHLNLLAPRVRRSLSPGATSDSRPAPPHTDICGLKPAAGLFQPKDSPTATPHPPLPHRWASCGLGWPCSWPSCPATTCVQAVEAASPHVGDLPSSFAQPPHRGQTASKGSGLRRPQVTSRGGEARFSSCLGTCLCSCSVHSRCPPCRPHWAQQIPPQSSHQLCGKDTLGCPPGTL